MGGIEAEAAALGQPITTPDGVTLIPISRVSMGFGCGGADYGKTQPKDFGGGSGAGVSVTPVAFLVVSNGNVRTVQLVEKVSAVDNVIASLPELKNISTRRKKKNPSERGILPSPNK